MNPVIDILAELQNDRARAVWLSTIPLGVIQRDHADIAAVLGAAGFSGGLAYLAALVAHINSVRLDDGSIPIETRQITDYSRKLMWGAVKQGEMVE